jgi:hypothetical protein
MSIRLRLSSSAGSNAAPRQEDSVSDGAETRQLRACAGAPSAQAATSANTAAAVIIPILTGLSLRIVCKISA